MSHVQAHAFSFCLFLVRAATHLITCFFLSVFSLLYVYFLQQHLLPIRRPRQKLPHQSYQYLLSTMQSLISKENWSHLPTASKWNDKQNEKRTGARCLI